MENVTRIGDPIMKRWNARATRLLSQVPDVKYAECGRMGTGQWFFEVEYFANTRATGTHTVRAERATQGEIAVEISNFLKTGGE